MSNKELILYLIYTCFFCIIGAVLGVSIYATASEGSNPNHPWGIGIVFVSIWLLIMFIIWIIVLWNKEND